ncbi:MAG: ABC transporter permease [Lachnospiraceae bacterium]|nr:ABC transporter permease [Lachnospiraceae bacterium]
MHSGKKLKENFEMYKEKIILGYPFVVLVLIIAIFQIWSGGKLVTFRNLKGVINEAFRLILGSAALAYIMSQGAIDLSTGSAIGIAAAIGAFCTNAFGPAGIFITLLVGAAIGLVNGVIYAKLKVGSFITTLSMSYMLGGLLDILLTAGNASIPFEMLEWDSTGLRFAVLIIICIAGYVYFEHGKLGRWCRAVGSNELAAMQAGVDVDMVKIVGFFLGGLAAGLLAFFALIRTGTASPSTGQGFQMDCMIAVFLGGMPITGGTAAKFRAAILGGITMTLLKNGMSIVGLDIYVQQFVQGVIFLSAVALTFNRKTMAVIK